MFYYLDTNVFIEAKNRYYAPDLCPGFWDALSNNKNIFTILEVRKEIEYGDDGLINFIEKINTINFDAEYEFQEILSLINSHYISTSELEKSEFLKVDAKLIAMASKNNAIVVSAEIPVINRHNEVSKAKRIKIPDVCNFMEVQCIDIFKMLRQLKIKFSF